MSGWILRTSGARRAIVGLAVRPSIVLLFALALVACSDRKPNLPPPVTGWLFQASPGMSAAPSGDLSSWSFAFPVGKEAHGEPAVHYVVRPAMQLRSTLLMQISIATSGAPRFQFRLNENNTCGGDATVSLYFQRRGDDWSGKGAFGSYRWFSRDALTLRDGEQALEVPLDVGSWINVWGQSDDRAGFDAAKADQMAIGLTFGGGCFKGHGVNISHGGASFVLREFR